MIRDEQPTFQGERPIRLIAKHGKNMIIDPKPREITSATMCWPIEGHLDQLSWESLSRSEVEGSRIPLLDSFHNCGN